ncbi:hypothetical protein Tco_0418658 [Tanacetum coccineum]
MSTEVHQAAETVTTSNELDLLFGPLFDEYFNGENQVVLKSSAVTTTDASNKRQQQPDSTSSTSTLATTVTANGNFDLMDDPNITMEEYIRLEEEKDQKRGKVFNWETAKYGKIWYDEDVLDLRSVETEFPLL